MKSQGFHPSAGAHWRLPAAGGCVLAPLLPLRVPSRGNTVDQRGGACAHERATEASEAGRAKRSGRAVNEGQEGLSERPARGHRQPRATAGRFLRGKRRHPVGFSWGGRMKSQGFQPAAGAHWRLPVAGGCVLALLLPLRVPSRGNTVDQRAGACAHERATEASEAGRAKRSGRAVNEGREGLSERPARGHRHPRAAAGSVESPGLHKTRPGV